MQHFMQIIVKGMVLNSITMVSENIFSCATYNGTGKEEHFPNLCKSTFLHLLQQRRISCLRSQRGDNLLNQPRKSNDIK